MYPESKLKPLKNLKTTSLFKFSLLLLLFVYSQNIFIGLLLILYFVYEDGKGFIIYLSIVLVVFARMNCTIPITNVTKLYDNPIKASVYNYITSRFDSKTTSYIKRFVYYENDYEQLSNNYQNLGFAYYYFIRSIYHKLSNKKRIWLIIIPHIFLFGFQKHLSIFLLTLIAKKLSDDKLSECALLIIMTSLINPFDLSNYSFIIPILFRIYNCIDNYLSRYAFMFIIQSLLFNCVRLFRLFFYRFYCLLMSSLYLLSLLVITFSFLEPYYIKVLSLIDNLLNYDLIIKGKLPLIIIWICYYVFKNFKFKSGYIQVSILLAIMYFKLFIPYTGVHYIDVGQGDATLIQTAFSNDVVLIDTGSRYSYHKLKNFLYSKGIDKIDKLVISHNDEDHSGNINNLIKDFNVEEIVTEHQDLTQGNLHFKSLNKNDYHSDNDNSLVLYTNIDNTSFIFLGDVSKQVENRIYHKYGPFDVDILKLAHHGSNTSSSKSFLNYINPKLAIISTSGKYNHPHEEVIENLRDLSIDYLITKERGSISYIMSFLGHFVITDSREFVIINGR